MKTRILAVIALFAFSSMAQAQMPPGKWWQRPEVVQELELTAEQRDKLDDAFRAAANELIDLKGDVEKLQIALRGELDRVQLRRPEIQRIAGQVSQARARLFERELMMLVDMRSVLTDPQWNKLRAHLDRMGPGPRERRGPGGAEKPMERRMPPGGRGRRP